MSQQALLYVAYPSKTPDGQPTKFNMDYYVQTHMSLIARVWTPYHMLSWRIISYNSSEALDPSNPPPYCVLAEVTFASLEKAEEALTQASEESGKDIQNYTNVVPAIWVGRGVASEGNCQGEAKAA